MTHRFFTRLAAVALFTTTLLGEQPAGAPSAPSLGIQPSGTNQIQVFWPATTNFTVLQEILGLEPTNSWFDVSDAPVVLGRGYSVWQDATNSASFYRLVSRGVPGSLTPPDPASIATPPVPNVFNDLASLTAFLYSGSNPIQVGVVPGTIKSVQASVLRGRVMQRDNRPLTGARVAILGHPEYGYTYSRTDGLFDLAVNAASYTVDFQAIGFCPAQRQMQVQAQAYGRVPDVILVPQDLVATSVQFGSNAPPQVAMSSPQTDAAGTRSATVFIPAGTSATMTMPDGSSQPMETLTIRVTEFTVGTNGPTAMPAALPPSSGYTYCADFSSDEAVNAGAKSVQFSQPMPVYVDNFLGVPVGTLVPIGSYDREQGLWVPSRNGIVMQVLGSTNGAALIDLHGAGLPETQDTLAANGFTDEELQSLAALYPAGKTLWRSPVPHFSIWDFNFGGAAPDLNKPNRPGDKPECDECDNSAKRYGTLNYSAQTFAEQIPLVGVPFSLNYSSARVPDYRVDSRITFPVAWQEPPPYCGSAPAGIACAVPPHYYDPPTGIRVELDVEGQQSELTYPGTNQWATISWDGKDAYGRLVGGTHLATINIAYVFEEWDYFGGCCGPELLTQFPALFGNTGNMISFAAHGQPGLGIGAVFQRMLTYPDHRKLGLGGWSPSPLHRLDPSGGILYYGDGRIRTVPEQSLQDDFLSKITSIQALATAAPDGTVYFYGYYNSVGYIFRRNPGGGYELVSVSNLAPGAVNLQWNTWAQVNGQSADHVSMEGAGLVSMSAGPDGSLYVTDNRVIARLTPDGIWHVILGLNATSPAVLQPDGTLAQDSFVTEQGTTTLAVGPDGSVYFTTMWGWASVNGTRYNMVRKIAPDGRLYTVLGAGGVATTNVSPTFYKLFGTAAYGAHYAPGASFYSLAVGKDGTVYVAPDQASDGYEWSGGIFKISPGGIILPVLNGCPISWAGYYDPDPTDTNRTALIQGDEGKLATEVMTSYWPARALQVGPDGSVYFTDNLVTIWRVNPNGILERVAGRYNTSVSPSADLPTDNGDPLNTYLYPAKALALTPDGTLFVVRPDTSLAPPIMIIPGRSSLRGTAIPTGSRNIASEDGTEVYVFDQAGRHLFTLDSLTGATRWAFGYDANSLVVTLTDLAGQVTRIERGTSGQPTAITGPYGQRTSLAMDANGFLSAVTNPAHETTSLSNSTGGLVLSITRPLGDADRIAYDEVGRAIQVTDPIGGGWTTSLVDKGVRADYSYETDVNCTNSLGHTLSRQMVLQPNGDTSVDSSHDGYAPDTATRRVSGDATTFYGDGSVVFTGAGADPRFGNQAQQTAALTVRFPNGLTYQETLQRSVCLANPADPFSLTGLTNVTTVNSNRYTMSYNPTNRTTTYTSPEGRRVSEVHDALGRVIRQSMPGSSVMDVVYDSFGRVMAVTNTSSLGVATTLSAYDALGQLSMVVDPLGRTNAFGYDAAGRLNRQVLPDGVSANLVYDSNGRLASVAPPGRPAHSFQYDAAGLMTRYSPPLLGTDESVDYQHDTERNLTSASLPDGQVVGRHYGLAGRLEQATLGDGPTLTYGYGTNLGSGYLLPATVSSSSGESVQLRYLASILTNVSWSGSVTGRVSAELNSDLLPVSQSVDGSTVSYQYNHDGLVIQAGDLSIVRDPLSGLVTETFLGGVTDQSQFDDQGGLTNYSASVNGRLIWSFTLGYDLAGRILTKVESIGGSTNTFGYGYDVMGRLAQVWRNGVLSTTYSYDDNGNRLSRNAETATYDLQDRLRTRAGATYNWSPNGHLQSVVSGGGTTMYSYDVRGALTGVAPAGMPAISYVVDPWGRRIGKKVGGTLQRGWLWDWSLRADPVPTAELDGHSGLTLRFVWGSDSTIPAYFEAGTNTYRILCDERGSVRLAVNVADGTIAQQIDYDEFGQVVSDTAPGFQPFGFAGGLYDPDTSLVRFGARDYDPALGRWTDRDPSRFDSGSYNLYAYCDNDPINRVDVDGAGYIGVAVRSAMDDVFLCLWRGMDCVELIKVAQRLAKKEAAMHGRDCQQGNENGYQQIHESLQRVIVKAAAKCTGSSAEGYQKLVKLITGM